MNMYQPLTENIRQKIKRLQETDYVQAAIGTIDKEGCPLVTKVVPMSYKGSIYLLLSDLSEHTKNIKLNDNVSIYFAAKETNKTKSNNSRLTLQGNIKKLNLKKVDPFFIELTTHYQKIESGSQMWAQFLDFNFYEFFESRKLFVDGFAKAYEEEF